MVHAVTRSISGFTFLYDSAKSVSTPIPQADRLYAAIVTAPSKTKALRSEFVKIRIWPAHPFLATLPIVGGASIAVQLLLSHDAALETSKRRRVSPRSSAFPGCSVKYTIPCGSGPTHPLVKCSSLVVVRSPTWFARGFKMPHTDKPAHTLTESIDQLERIREELLRIQRALEKIERAPPDADPPSEA